MFLQFDEDQNGVLTMEEVQKALSTIDKNSNGDEDYGVVDAGELAETFQGAGLTNQDLMDLMSYLAVLNKSKLGNDEEIDYETFINGIFAMHNPSTRKDSLEILAHVRNSMKETQNYNVRLTDMGVAIGALDKKIGLTIRTQTQDTRLRNMESAIKALDTKMNLLLEQLQKDSRST